MLHRQCRIIARKTLLMNIVQKFWIISSLWHDDGSRYSLCSSALLTRVILLLWYIVGLGYCSVWVSWLIGLYYNVIIAHVLFYLGASMTKELPWSHCDHAWSSPYCRVPNENYTIPGKCTTQRYSVVLLQMSVRLSITVDHFPPRAFYLGSRFLCVVVTCLVFNADFCRLSDPPDTYSVIV